MNYNKIKLIELKLPDFNKDIDEASEHLRFISYLLDKDKYWHFFYEGDYTLIRCSKKHVEYLEKCLTDHGIKFENKGEWIDGSAYVEKYKSVFIPIFHNYSLLALTIAENDIMMTGDRICHSFFNHCTYAAEKYRDLYGDYGWESILMGTILVKRAEHIGYLNCVTDIKKKYEQGELENALH